MKDGRSRLSRPDALFHSSHLGPEFRVLCLLMSVPNRVWDSMGSPCLTYLASYISSGGPRCFFHSQTMHIRLSGRSYQMSFKSYRGQWDSVPVGPKLCGARDAYPLSRCHSNLTRDGRGQFERRPTLELGVDSTGGHPELFVVS